MLQSAPKSSPKKFGLRFRAAATAAALKQTIGAVGIMRRAEEASAAHIKVARAHASLLEGSVAHAADGHHRAKKRKQ